jgi:hypothetical protein
MDKKTYINQLVEDSIRSVDEAKRATPLPYLSTRVNNRLSKKNNTSWPNQFYFINKPAVAFGALAFLILVNITALFVNDTDTIISFTTQSANDAQDETSDIATSIFDIVNIEP